MKLKKALESAERELDRAFKNYPAMASPHEGFAILLEEVDELWDEVKPKPYLRSRERMREEAMQIAAMAIRFAVDLT